MLHVQGSCCACVGCNWWSSELLLPFCGLAPVWPLTSSTRHVPSFHPLDIFLCFGIILGKPWRRLCCYRHRQFLKSHFNPFCPGAFRSEILLISQFIQSASLCLVCKIGRISIHSNILIALRLLTQDAEGLSSTNDTVGAGARSHRREKLCATSTK